MPNDFLIMNNYKETIDEVIEKLILKHRELGQKATGNWERSLESEVKEDALLIKGFDYTKYLVEGRPPSNKRPPIKALEQWVKAKFGVQGKKATSIAFAVANKIKKEGTTWHQRGGSDLLEFLDSQEIKSFIEEQIGTIKLNEVQLAFTRQFENISI
jgi:hypothetical protein